MSLDTDYKDAITLISDLQPKQRNKGIKLFTIIANNIINNRTERKWKYLHHEKIYKKFGSCSDEFMFLILQSGFKIIKKPKKTLIFNDKNIALLRHITKELTNYQQLNQNSITKSLKNNLPNNKKQHPIKQNTSINNKQKRTQRNIYNIQCICGHVLLQTTQNYIYQHNDEILCDICMIEMKPNDIIWHCTNGTNSKQHKYNYDLCNNCALKKLQSTHRYRSNFHSKKLNAN